MLDVSGNNGRCLLAGREKSKMQRTFDTIGRVEVEQTFMF
jgi:hypothetical protein